MSKSTIKLIYDSVVNDNFEDFKTLIQKSKKDLDKIRINTTENVTLLHILGTNPLS